MRIKKKTIHQKLLYLEKKNYSIILKLVSLLPDLNYERERRELKREHKFDDVPNYLFFYLNLTINNGYKVIMFILNRFGCASYTYPEEYGPLSIFMYIKYTFSRFLSQVSFKLTSIFISGNKL